MPALENSLCSAQANQSSSAASPGQHPDPFTAQLQRRTEDDLRALLEKRSTTEEEPAADEEDAEEEVCKFGIMLSHSTSFGFYILLVYVVYLLAYGIHK